MSNLRTWRRSGCIPPLAAVMGLACADAVAQPTSCSSYPQIPGTGDWQSSRVYYSGGRLTYPADSGQNRIPDYSYAGYRYGQAPIPSVPEVQRLSATTGDQTARIQAALDQVGARTPDSRGLRGALLLEAGSYTIQGTLRINRSGVVLRGVGDGTTGTVLRITGDTPHQRTGVILGTRNPIMHGPTNDLGWTEVSPRSDITTSFVQVGARSFDVASTAGFAPGDEVVLRHPSTSAWITALNGGGASTWWTPGTQDIVYYRRIQAVSGTTVTLDAPVYNHLDRALSQAYLTRVSTSVVTESGIENLRVDIVTAGGQDENHAWNAIGVYGAHDSWVRNVTTLHFGYAGVRLNAAVRVTVHDVQALDPVGIRTGARFYNFAADRGAQLVLISRCHATGARHGFVGNGGPETSGLVWYRCTGNGTYDNEGGHKHWTQGVLYDNFAESGSGSVKLITRGNWGDQHGWSSAHSTSWRFNKASYVQRPPTAQNYGVTDIGTFSTSYAWAGPTGFTEVRTGRLVPASLYEAQFCERTAGQSPTPTPTPTPRPSLTPTATPTVPGGAVEITPGAGSVSASTHDGNLPANTVDGSLLTRWSAAGDGAWIRYDLGSTQTVAFVTLAAYNGNSRQNRFDLQLSSDGVSWTNVITGGLTSGTTTAEEAHDFPDQPARYVRYLGHMSTAGTFNSLTEVGIYAPDGGGTVTPTPLAPTPTPTATPMTPPTPTPTPGGFSGYYRIMARHSGKAVNVQGASTANAANVIQWTYGGASTNDEWSFVAIGGGYYHVVARHSGKAMNVSGLSTADGGDVIQWPISAGANDDWQPIALGDGYYRLIVRHSGKVLNVSFASTADGANVDQWSWTGGAHQQFQLLAVP